MSELTISVAHNTARLEGSMAHADSGTGSAYINVYDASAVLLGVVHLAKPCGAIVGGFLVLEQADPTADLVLVSGAAASAKMFNGAGLEMASGAVTDEAGAGPFKLGGTAGTTLYAGGKLLLGTTALE